jgi:type I restriction enzyme S subunit
MNLKQTELPPGWVWTTMEEIADVVGGGTPKTNDPTNYEGGTIPWITPADLSGYTAKQIAHGARFITQKGLNDSSAKMMPAGTVLFTSRAPIGYVAIASNPVCTNQGFKSFVLKEGVLPNYVYWWLKGSKDLAESMASGTTFLELSGAKAKQIPIPVAPLDQQKRIVAEIEKQFSRLDEAVANLKRVKANLKRYKAAVLKAAVEGRLVETEAELTRKKTPSPHAGEGRGDGASYETGAQLLQRILETRRSQWKGKGKYKEPAVPDTTDLPELPEGWVWAALGQLVWSVKDGPHFSPRYSEEGIPFISGGNIRPEGIDFSSTKFISPELHEELSKRCKPEYGDLLYTKGGTTGIARVNTETREFNVWVHVAVLKLMDSIEPFYLQHALNSPHCYRQAQRYTHGVGNQDLGLTRMVWITVPLPSALEQKRIVAEIDRRLSLIREVEAQVDANLKRAERLRQSILSRAFAGSLCPEEKLAEAVA